MSETKLKTSELGGKSEGPAPESMAEELRRPPMAAGVDPHPATDIPAAVPNHNAVEVATDAKGKPLTQAAALAAIGKHPFEMSEKERSKLPIIVNHEAESSLASNK